MTDVAHFGFADDVACSFYLVEKFGVATVPGSAFYNRAELGKTKVRFAFPKKIETLQMAAERLRKFIPAQKIRLKRKRRQGHKITFSRPSA